MLAGEKICMHVGNARAPDIFRFVLWSRPSMPPSIEDSKSPGRMCPESCDALQLKLSMLSWWRYCLNV